MKTRRGILRAAAGTSFAGLLGGPIPFRGLSRAAAQKVRIDPKLVQLRPEIEPVVKLIETTPREKVFEVMAEQLGKGLPYRHFLAALYLAGVRNVSPQPPGFKFHCVFAIHSAHQASLDAPVGERLLPLFWALDNFKASQQRDVEEGDFNLTNWTGPLPSESQAWGDFHRAMEDWDQEKAEAAVIRLVRSRGAHEMIEGLWQYGARDYRNIGHKAIFVANTWRTLQTIGWHHAEPALRSLVLGLLDFGKNEKLNAYAYEDQSWLPNVERTRKNIGNLRPGWSARVDEADVEASKELLEILRAGELANATDFAVDLLTGNRLENGQTQAIWDAIHVAAGELMIRQPGIYGIHTVTSANGLRYAFETTGDRETRLVLLLQGIGWMCQFHRFMSGTKNGLEPYSPLELEAITENEFTIAEPKEILALIGKDTPDAAQKAFRLVRHKAGSSSAVADQLAREAYPLIFRKGTDAHDYKWAAAVFEDFHLLSPAWRPHLLAAGVYNLKGSWQKNSPVMSRAREVVGRIG